MRHPITLPRAVVCDGAVELTWLKSTPCFTGREEDEFQCFRVWRRDEAGFEFGVDYEEYFAGSGSEGAELVFEGSLEATNNRRYAFRDASVEVGHTYSYWVQSMHSKQVGPTPVRVRDPEVWWSVARLRSALRELEDAAKGLVEVSVCGRTAMGEDIPCVRAGRGERGVGLVGVVHGGESGPELIVPAIGRLVREEPELLRKTRVVAIPSLNIDSREREAAGTPWYIRTNQQGVDLNRNFPADWGEVDTNYGLDSSEPGSMTYRGPRAASAPETRAAMAAFEAERLDAVFCYHCLASICGLPALGPKAAEGDSEYAARCEGVIDVFRRGFHPEAEFEGACLKYGTTAGSLPAWLYETARIPAFDLEGGVDKAALEKCRYDRTDQALLCEYQERHYRGIREVLEVLS